MNSRKVSDVRIFCQGALQGTVFHAFMGEAREHTPLAKEQPFLAVLVVMVIFGSADVALFGGRELK